MTLVSRDNAFVVFSKKVATNVVIASTKFKKISLHIAGFCYEKIKQVAQKVKNIASKIFTSQDNAKINKSLSERKIEDQANPAEPLNTSFVSSKSPEIASNITEKSEHEESDNDINDFGKMGKDEIIEKTLEGFRQLAKKTDYSQPTTMCGWENWDGTREEYAFNDNQELKGAKMALLVAFVTLQATNKICTFLEIK